MHYQYYKPNLTMLLVSNVRSGKCSINLCLPFVKFPKALIWLFSPTGRRAQAKPIRCLVVIGKLWYLKIWTLKDRIPFSRIFRLMRISLELSPGPFINSSIKSKCTNKPNPNSEYTVRSYKFTTRKYMISSRTFRNPKRSIFINRNSMGFSSKG